MTIDIDQHSGFCFGVTTAIRKAEEELQRGSLCCLGDIVHNGQEVQRLEQLGLQTIDHSELQRMRGGRVLLRAHGEPPSTYQTARENGIEIIDASCPVVLHLQKRIRTTYLEHPDAQIVIFGKQGHAEVIGLQGQTDNTAIVIESIRDIEQIDRSKPIYLFSQTTKSVEEFEQIVQALQPTVYYNTICKSVANRVNELRAFAQTHDIILFVGGTKSSNAKVLCEECRQANPNTFFISQPEQVKQLPWFAQTEQKNTIPTDCKVGITGATSTPLWLMEQVKHTLILCMSK